MPRRGVTDLHELIFYATPTGSTAAACEAIFNELESTPTTAQRYPPHCTLTGFFRRRSERVARIAVSAQDVIDRFGPIDPTAVDAIVAEHSDWIGLELTSAVLHDAIEGFVAAIGVEPGEDLLRPKDWLHLSLAYPLNSDVDHSCIDHSGIVRRHRAELTAGSDPWELGLWERNDDGTWLRHTRPAVNPSP